jgi:cob(I)alamin adenosyltransferase
MTQAKVRTLETITDSIEQALPPIHSFLLAGGTRQSALLDVTRTIARRAERTVVAMHEEGVQKVGPHTLAYLNRLSSVLYALVRYANHLAEAREEAPTYR